MITESSTKVAGTLSPPRGRRNAPSPRICMVRRIVSGVLVAASASAIAVAAPTPAIAERRVDVNETTYTATGLDGHPELRRGFVLDITFGRTLGAIEFHSVIGAAPDTDYTVRAEVFFATECASDDPIGAVPLDEGTLSTNAAGNGSFSIRFPGEAFDTAPPSFWVRWLLVSDHGVAYRSGCVGVELDR